MAVVDLSGHSTYRQRRFGVQYHGILFCSPVIGVRYDWFADSSDTFFISMKLSPIINSTPEPGIGEA